MHAYIHSLPKAELHVHLEGTLEPELLLRLAQKHGIPTPYESVEAARAAYQFDSLQSFLNLYYKGADVLRDAEDFYTLTWEYLTRAHAQNVCHVEPFFDPQTHTARGIPLGAVFEGITGALRQGEKELGITSGLIMCFLRDLSEEAALATFEAALPFREQFVGVGLDSAEVGNPPRKFARVFAKAKAENLHLVAHAGEEGDSSYIWDALNTLHVTRIDHGIACEQDPTLVAYLREHAIPLTVCPLSNLKLKAVPSMEQHNILRLLKEGVCVTVNSDDPVYFGGCINENYEPLVTHLGATKEELKALTCNSFRTSFLSEKEKQAHLARVEKTVV
jgi:adenosine deaminase